MKRMYPLNLLACVVLAMLTLQLQAQDPFDFDFGDAGNGNGEAAPAAPQAPEAQPDAAGFGFQAPATDVPAPQMADDVAPEDRMAEAVEVERQERIRIEARVAEGRRNFADAENAMGNNQWQLAIDLYDEALSKFKDVPDLADIRNRANQQKANAFFQMARSQYERRREGADLDRVREFLNRSENLVPNQERITLMRAAISEYEIRVADGREERRIEDEEKYTTARERINRLLLRGRQELEIGDLDAAKASFDEVLAYDRYNEDALRFLERVAERRWEVRRIERRASVMEAMAEGESRWLSPRPVDRRGPMAPGTTTTPVVRQERDLENRMAAIRIPEIRFQGAHISDVISFLVQASREADPDGIGVNIIFMDPDLINGGGGDRPAAAPAQPAAADPFAAFMAPTPAAGGGGAPRGGGRIPPISLEVRDVSLLDALQLVTEIANLYYRIERNIVVIDRRGRGTLVTRFYSVDPTLFTQRTQSIQPRRIGGGGGGGGDPFGGDPFGAPQQQQGGGDGPDVRAIFERYGVNIPENGEIAYDPLVSQLVVTLTPDEFDQFEEVLRVINVTPRQVQIEARFVEVLQRDLEQLGFEWILRDDAELLVRDGPGPVGARERIQVDQNPQGLTGGLRFFNFDSVAQATTPQARSSQQFNPLGDIMSMRGVLTNPELQMVVHALNQRGNSDLLSAPRVTTINGVNAIIEVVNEIIYPTEFDVTQNDIQVQGGGAAGEAGAPPVFIPPTVIPGGFETRQVGVILNVTPTVAADNYTINLTMLPEIAELVDWLQYGTQVPIGDQIFTVNMPQPVFASRNVTTSMIVWDGHTVVMGGLIREDLLHYKDKVPLLGDLPLIGRLFRSEGTKSEKRNLLIFVTASLVDPSGNPVNTGRQSELVTGGIQQTGGSVSRP